MSKQTNSSQNGPQAKRTRLRAGFRLVHPIPSSSQPTSSSTSSLFVTPVDTNEVEGQNGGMQVEAGEMLVPDTNTTAKPKRHRYTTKSHHLTEWLQFRETFLDKVLRHDSLGSFFGQTSCSKCGEHDGVFKCKDCSEGSILKCLNCTIGIHHVLPLHCVEKWNGSFFAGPKNFVIFDTSGLHHLTIDYCQCGNEPLSSWAQLLRESWFPATLSHPQTAFTFDCLDMFHELMLQGNTNLYDYYHTLLRRSDNANLSTPVYRYPEIHRVFRMWRNLMSLKRAGCSHDPEGVWGTSQGELMVECLACPHPKRNLPDDWEKAGPLLFLYALFIAVNGNFKLKGKERHIKDVELMPGWGAYVPESEYQDHVENYVDEPEFGTRFFVLKTPQRGVQNERSTGRCFQPVFGDIQPHHCQKVGSHGDCMECQSNGSKPISGTTKR
ncbi:hypothetical protein K443DRAFT_135485 [Laccaria amethystina LaAM-08-1]|uniref:CxC2-like cysteine cluster KDZ transposase-associated domain-containing protein n=1 Tax=Laccaria amethystina LaAM-08-1 TaxID=1095629 RepID=A0A0C9X4V4_9AGAR|nr:hypothetical protein K443DRAFT_135485 [Laccaria amethystina LaAM-08-1]